MNFKYLAIASIEQKQACRDWDFLNISLFVSNERCCGFNAIFSSGYIERYSSKMPLPMFSVTNIVFF